MRYVNAKVNISEGQKETLQHAIKVSCSVVCIRLGHEDLKGNDILAVTNSQAKKLAKAQENGKIITIRMTLKQQYENRGWFSRSYGRISCESFTDDSENHFTGVRCWCPFRVRLIGSTESDGVGSLSQERRMRLPSGKGWSGVILKTVQR